MKKPETVLREYTKRLSDEDLRNMNSLLTQRLSGDTARALDYLSRIPDMDRLLRDQKSSGKLFDVLEKIQTSVVEEMEKRYGADHRK